MRRRGISIVEMVIITPIIVIVIGLCTIILYPSVKEPPRMERASQTHSQINRFLESLQQDINAAVSLPQQYEQTQAGPEVLLLDTGDAVLCYRVEKDRITRNVLNGKSDSEEQLWDTPDAKVAFSPWPGDVAAEAPRAIRVRTAVEYFYDGEPMEKLVNSRILFLAAMPDAREVLP